MFSIPTDGLSSEVLGMVQTAQVAEREARHAAARESYERALHACHPSPGAWVAAALIRRIGRSYFLESDTEAAFDCFQAALAIAEACGDRSGMAHALNQMGAAHQQRGDLDQAEELFQRALELAAAERDHALVAMVHQNRGIIANIRGDLTRALEHYQHSLSSYRELQMEEHAGLVLNNMGMLYTDLREWGKAEATYSEALAACSRIGNVDAQMMVEVNRCELWISQQNFERAREACLSALALAERFGNTRALGEIYKNLGVIQRETGELRAAERHLLHAADIASSTSDLLLAAEAARELADLKWRQQENRLTLQYLNRAHNLFGQLRAHLELMDIDHRVRNFESTFLEIVRRWGDSIESKDRYTQGHCERVTDLACRLAAACGLDERTLFWFRMGALLHDVGKIVVPSEVLNKPGALTPEERQIIERHPEAGVELLDDIEFPWDIRPMVRHHHERWDGKGYPLGLARESIPLSARILCIADVYDALSSDRPYRPALSHERTMQIMEGDMGSMFDPELFSVFRSVVREEVGRRMELRMELQATSPAAHPPLSPP